MTKNEFIAYLAPYAVRLRCEGSPMFPSVRLAQNLLETGGKIHAWYNLGGIKVGAGKPNQWWDGSSVHKGTWEVINGQRIDTSANFRAYKSIYHFYKDQDLLFNNTRYARVRAAKTPIEQANMLYACGYATDPQYAAKLISIINSYDLTKYDKEVDQVLRQIEELTAANKRLEERLAKLEPKKPEDQKVLEWAEAGHEFITTDRELEKISDGRRPEDHVTRQEVWAMLERANRLLRTRNIT